MTKRARGATRPGQRRPVQRVGARPTGRPSSAEPIAAAATMADDAANLIVAASTSTSAREPSRARARPSGAFSATAAQEYAYVATDVRRIAVVGGGLFATMLVLYVLIEVVHLVRI